MPSQKELQWAQLRVGLTVVFASVVLGALVFLMTGTIGLFTPKLTLYTYAPDASGLRNGAPVRLQNVDIGNVDNLEIVPDRPTSPVRITLKVAGKAARFLKKDSVASLTTTGVLGETFVNIDSTQAKGAPIENRDTLASRDVPGIEDVVRSSQSTLQNIDVLVQRADRIVSAIENAQGSAGQFIYDKALYNNLNKSVQQVQQILNDVSSGKGSIGLLLKSDDLYNKLNASVDKLNRMMDELNAGQGTAGLLLKDPTLYRNANQTINKANQLIDNINSGKGALGKFAADPEFAKKLQNIVDSLSDITSRLNRGEGTAGRLLHDTAVYDNANNLMVESRELIKAIRQNPKRYLTIRLKIF